MAEILSIDNGERRERVNKKLREIFHENSSEKRNGLRLGLFVVVVCWFTVYGIWTFANDVINLLSN